METVMNAKDIDPLVNVFPEHLEEARRLVAHWSVAPPDEQQQLTNAVRNGLEQLAPWAHACVARTLVRRVLQAGGKPEPTLLAAASCLDEGFGLEMARRGWR
jgi:hypothetical protein